jgi:hypothetical protein
VNLKPIFDTNIFDHVQRGLISSRDWSHLLRHRPRRGWPLSQVTAFELLAGVHFGGSKGFAQVRRRIEIAYDLSKGRVLDDPRILICKNILGIPFPADKIAPAASTASRYLDAVRRAQTLEQLLRIGVPYRGKRLRLKATLVLADLMAGPKRQWIDATEAMANEKFPGWRELFQTEGKRLPPQMRKELEPRSAWEAQRSAFIDALLDWLGASRDPKVASDLYGRLDAVLEFTVFVAREFLLQNYSLEKHQSDVFDAFQLEYLAMDEFVIVSGDADLSHRTLHSSQACRIVSFDEFVRSIDPV